MADVDRSYPIASWQFALDNPRRIRVRRGAPGRWWVLRGADPCDFYPTHARAVTEAHRIARRDIHNEVLHFREVPS